MNISCITWRRISTCTLGFVSGLGLLDSSALADVTLTVNPNGSAQYTTVQAAINAVPASPTQRYVISIAPGSYFEQINVNKPKVTLRGTGLSASQTILTYNQTAQPGNILSNASTAVTAIDFAAQNLTFENTAGQNAGQALAMNIRADRAVFDNCRFLGWQDTLRPEKSRSYFKDCYVEGHTDFIYGKGQAYFDTCTTYSKAGGYVTAQGREAADETNGFIFYNCTVTGSAANNSVTLGRPWQIYSRSIFDRCFIGPVINSVGWTDLSSAGVNGTAYFAEYQSKNLSGATLNVSSRVAWSHQLTAADMVSYTRVAWLSGTDNWDPTTVLPEPAAAGSLVLLGFAVLKRNKL